MDLHNSLQIAYNIPGEMWPSELVWLYHHLAKSKIHVEVGTFCGRSLFATCAGMSQGSKVICVDANLGYTAPIPWVQSVRGSTIKMAKELTGVHVELMESYSLDAARAVHDSGQMIDSIFIDGDHNVAEVTGDIQAWLPLLRPGGLICGHDYWAQHTGVMLAVQNEFFGRFQVAENTRIWWAKK
jgi:predicted O-methyltransferase YrrM